MELKDLVQALRRFWLLAAAVLMLVVGAGAAAAFVPTPKYTATATLLIQPKGSAIDFSSIDAVNFLLPSIVTQVGTRGFQRRVLSRLPRFVADTRPSVSARLEPGTAIVRISGTSTQPEAAALLANSAAREESVRPVTPSRIDVSLLAPANVPTAPSSPRRVPILAGATVLGTILSLFVALGANGMRRRMQSLEQIEQRLGIEVLAEVPSRRRLPTSATEILESERYVDVAEAFQRLRTHVELSLADDLAIAVTSTAPGEGKSTVAAGLAWTLASIGHEVVAVDCDLRRPTLHRALGVRLEGGVGELAEGAELPALLQETEQPTLSVLSAGTVLRHPAQVLHSVLPGVLEDLDERVVIIDTPPMLGVSEATFVASVTSAVLLVIDARRRDPTEIERVLTELRRGNARILGAVVNRARLRHASYAAAYYVATHHRERTPPSGRRVGRTRS